jgi:transglutaminase/protease-like cytokinesis protein 3
LLLFQFQPIQRSEREKVKLVYDYVVLNYRFDNTLHNESNLYRILCDKGTSCAGFSYLFSSILNGFKIKNVMEDGLWARSHWYGELPTKSFHVWNKVFLDGKWLYVDCTWGIFNREEGKDIYENFLSDKRTFSKTHFFKK